MKTILEYCSLVSLAFAGTVHAETYVVDREGNGDYWSIENAVRWAPAGSTIALVPGFYPAFGVDGRESNALTIEAVEWAPAGTVVIQGRENDRAAIQLTEFADMTFRNLTIHALGHDLVHISDSNVTFEGCLLEDASGTGLSITGESNVSFVDGTISGMQRGGIMMLNVDGEVRIVDSVLRNNKGDSGGAVERRRSSGSELLVQRTDFIGNSAAASGGALWLGPGQNIVRIENCRFMENHANVDGGAIWAGNVNLQVLDTTVSQNSSDRNGGGVTLIPDQHVTQKFTDCFISNNTAHQGAGGGVRVELFNFSCGVRFKNCEILGNVAGLQGGGGIANEGLGEVELYGSLLCSNWPDPASGDLHLSDTPVLDRCGTGACCLGDMCIRLTQSSCLEAAGTWQGAGTSCLFNSDFECDVKTGACCFGSYCLLMSDWECDQHEGRWHGEAVLCADVSCEKPKPGDLDRDGKVDVNDLLKLFAYWGD